MSKNMIPVLEEDTQTEEKNHHTGLKIVMGLGIAAVAAVATGIMMTKNAEIEGMEPEAEQGESPLDAIGDKMIEKKEEVADAAENIKDGAVRMAADVQDKADDVKKHLHSGYRKISKDLHRTATAVTRDMK